MIVQAGNSARRAVTFAIVMVMMLGSLAAPMPTMAQSQTIQSSLTGVSIAYEAPYSLLDDGQFVDDAMEAMMFAGPADVLAIGFMSPLIDLNGARDVMVEALFGESGSSATIDRGDYTGVSYSLDMLNVDGQEMGVFSLFMSERSHGYSEFYIFLAPPSLFGSTMQTAQSSFTIDGNPLMDGVDPLAMGNMVTANVGITGGEAVTDVTEVTDPEDTGTDTSGTDTTETDTTGTDDSDTTDQGGEGDQLTYVLAVMQEYTVVDASLINIANSLDQYSNDEITADQAFDAITTEAEFLAGLNDRVALIEVPAGMEDLHEETLYWADAVSSIGTTWIAAIDGTGTQDAASSALSHGIDVHIEFGDTLQGHQISIGESGDTSESGETTETTQTDTGATDADAYIESIQNHRSTFYESFGAFNSSLASLDGEPTDAEIRTAFDATLVEAEAWAGYSATAQQLTPPPGYEGVQEAYLAWAGHVTEMGNLWIAALNGEEGQLDAFFDYIPTLEQSETDLDVAIADAEGQASGDSNGASTVGNDGDDTGDSSETITRTTRSSGTTEDEDVSDSVGTTERPDRTQRSSGSSGDDEEITNTSETSGNASADDTDVASTDLPNEWLTDANGVSITWSDDFALTSNASESQVSDVSAGEDVLYLQATTGGGSVPVLVTVLENPGNDSTAIVDALVEDPAQAEDIWGPDTQIHDSTTTPGASAVLMHAEDEIGGYWVYLQVTCLDPSCGTLVLLDIATEGAPLVETLDIARSGLAVDGVSVSAVMPIADVEDTVERIGD